MREEHFNNKVHTPKHIEGFSGAIVSFLGKIFVVDIMGGLGTVRVYERGTPKNMYTSQNTYREKTFICENQALSV